MKVLKEKEPIKVGFKSTGTIVPVIVKDITPKPIEVTTPNHPIIIGEPYKGEYVVTPRAKSEVKLPTTNKTLIDDITVKKVPYYETSNKYGSTVYIASEV